MSLVAARFHDPRVEVVGTSNAWGDHVGHTALRGAARQAELVAMLEPPASAAKIRDGYGSSLIAGFVVWARAHGVRVIGGLATQLDQGTGPDVTRAAIEAVYLAHGGEFLALPNLSRYPLTAFFDTPLHLNEPCQIAHSILLARALGPLLGRVVRVPPGPPQACPGIPAVAALARLPPG